MIPLPTPGTVALLEIYSADHSVSYVYQAYRGSEIRLFDNHESAWAWVKGETPSPADAYGVL